MAEDEEQNFYRPVKANESVVGWMDSKAAYEVGGPDVVHHVVSSILNNISQSVSGNGTDQMMGTSMPPHRPEFDSGETAWVLACTALTWIMIPGVGFFYNGMAPRKSSLILFITCFWSCAVVSIQWYLVGYSLCLSNTGGPFIGNFDHIFLRNIDDSPAAANEKIPALLLGIWYCLFAAITPTIILGGIVERARFLPSVVFIFLWSTFVFDFLCYWVWNANGWNFRLGALDFGGGTPVHISTGAAALGYALVLGKRKDPRDKPPHNMTHVLLGTSFIWCGWLVANAGSGLKPNLRAVNVFITTNLAASVGGIVWALLDYRKERKFSAFGFCCGAICGLVAITPASGYVSASSSLVFGIVGAIICNLSMGIKKLIRIDDAFDVFCVHGLGGVVGNVLTGVFAQKSVAAVDGTVIAGGWLDGNWEQVGHQILDTLAGGGWSFVITVILVGILDKIPGLSLRVPPQVELDGVDKHELGEPMYHFFEEFVEKQDETVKAAGMNGVKPLARSSGNSVGKLESGGNISGLANDGNQVEMVSVRTSGCVGETNDAHVETPVQKFSA